jgi:hypothetical protein
MADDPIVKVGENSPEQVAFQLLRMVATIERVSLSGEPTPDLRPATKAWLLNTYTDCIHVVRGSSPPAGRLTGDQWLQQ